MKNFINSILLFISLNCFGDNTERYLIVLSDIDSLSNIKISTCNDNLIISLDDNETAILDFIKDGEVMTQKLIKNELKISFENVPNGTYYIGIIYCDKYYDLKIIKIKTNKNEKN